MLARGRHVVFSPVAHSGRSERKRPEAYAGRAEDGVPDRRGDRDDRALTRAGRCDVTPVEDDDLDVRHVREPRQPVLREAPVGAAAVRERDGLEKRPTEALDDRALDLPAEVEGLITAPQSKACTTRRTRTSPREPTETSTQVAT